MVDVIDFSAYKESSEGDKAMAERITVVATKSETTITRLVAGVELALRNSGKSWTLSVKPGKQK